MLFVLFKSLLRIINLRFNIICLLSWFNLSSVGVIVLNIVSEILVHLTGLRIITQIRLPRLLSHLTSPHAQVLKLELTVGARDQKAKQGVAAPSNLSMNQTLDGHHGKVRTCPGWALIFFFVVLRAH